MDHYQLLRQQWRSKIASMDPSSLAKKLPCLTSADDGLHILYWGKDHVISNTGAVFAVGNPRPISWTDEMNILTHLWYAKENAKLSGQWVPFYDLTGASPYGPAFLRGNLLPLAKSFHGHGAKLRKALQTLDGIDLHMADVGYEISAFPYIPVRILFWDGDEEFPSQVNLLFDRSATEFIHVESIVTIASSLQNRLSILSGL